ncbi:PIN-like domain-containing protein [Sphaerisporangium rhizosphaerae]|uniref:PIN-like domain-containing protein n=1 Tax=Sphaerisporangium rhizosphaerae TaxID=2269375 RepID=A0ABW2P5H1_9ACTN
MTTPESTAGKAEAPSADVGTPFGLFDGFEAYRTPTEQDHRDLLTTGLVVPDTNVLLNLYRYNDRTRHDLLDVLRGLGKTLWVPRQVVVEFWRNREAVLADPRESAKTTENLEQRREGALRVLRGWAGRVDLPHERCAELTDGLSRAFETVIAAVGELDDAEAAAFVGNTSDDWVLSALEEILRGRVGAPLGEDEHAEALAEARRRGQARIPPGYMDAAKDPEAAAGDYLIWVQTLREARRRRVDVLLVTGDLKEDWWRREGGEPRGPRYELAEEMAAVAGVGLFMLRPDDLLRRARSILRVAVREESVENVERVGRSLAEAAEEDRYPGADVPAPPLPLTGGLDDQADLVD